MTTYRIAETTIGAHVTTWTATKARTLAGAKRAAQAARTFQGTLAHVGQLQADGSVKRIATRTPKGQIGEGWTDFD